MNTVDNPDRIMANIMPLRSAGGKFWVTFAGDQSSRKPEQTMRTGIERRLL